MRNSKIDLCGGRPIPVDRSRRHRAQQVVVGIRDESLGVQGPLVHGHLRPVDRPMPITPRPGRDPSPLGPDAPAMAGRATLGTGSRPDHSRTQGVITMRALVVFESMYGNTRDVAAAIAEGLGSHLDTDLVEVGSAPTGIGEDVSLLVVGGPTHVWGMSRPKSRESAAEQTDRPVVSGRIGMREWLEALPPGDGHEIAAFDTRVRRPRMPGSAARKAERELKKRGYGILHRAETFWVTGSQGPLVDGERERARAWGEQLGAELRDRTGS
jgi:hypothetical protein